MSDLSRQIEALIPGANWGNASSYDALRHTWRDTRPCPTFAELQAVQLPDEMTESITPAIRSVAEQLLVMHADAGIEPQEDWGASIVAYNAWLLELDPIAMQDGLRKVSLLLALERSLHAVGGTWEQVLYIHQKQAAAAASDTPTN
jgi:hypothetical protein